jgi:hypothetical protein
LGINELLALVAFLIGLPGIISFLSYKNRKNKIELDKIKYQKEILELEIEKEKIKLKSLEEENKKMDKIINENNITGLLN